MTEPRRIPVMAPNGTKLILVVDGVFFTGVEDDFIVEEIPMKSIIAVEECPPDEDIWCAAGFKPGSQDGVPSPDPADSDPPVPLH